MKKICLLAIVGILFIGCNKENVEPVLENLESSPEAVKVPEFSASYLPTGWIQEDGFYYSPETYKMKEGGPYSLSLNPSTKFETVAEYMTANKDCISEKTDFTIGGLNGTQYRDTCYNNEPIVFLAEIEGFLFEGFSYGAASEFEEIQKIVQSVDL
ncbi:hypothetical protein KA119_00540 [Candidatus Gracilibacteria bacterium]|nr:hypothetical protein [Candidatus Gracilibacteria bacterium]